MARAFETKPGRAPLPAAAQRPAAPTRTVPPAADFPQLARRLHLGAPIQRRAGASPGRDFSDIAGPGRPALPGGLPAGLRADVEARSGLPMDDVRVHRNSPKPRTIGALAYAQGRDIHLGPGQEKHLAHEAWHVVQQKQGRVRSTVQMRGLAINDDENLEREADHVGATAPREEKIPSIMPQGYATAPSLTVQCQFDTEDAAIRHLDDGVLPDPGDRSDDLASLRDLAEKKGWQTLKARIASGQASQPRKLLEMPLTSVFEAMLRSFDRPYASSDDNVVKNAHKPNQKLVEDQTRYQDLMTEKLSLDRDQIMEFHRSAGFEYEFSGFYDRKRPQTQGSDKELLRSHIELARSEIAGSVFSRWFMLETDSYNTLEMVTPPFVFLISKETKDVTRRADEEIRKQIKNLRDKLMTPDPSAANAEEEGKEDSGGLGKNLDGPKPSTIKSHLGALDDLGFGSGWTWTYGDDLELSASTKGAKHGSDVLGQINLSLTANEIIGLMPILIDKSYNFLGLSTQNPKLDPAYAMFETLYALLCDDKNPEMNGILGFYAKSISSLLGIPSVLYRSKFKERPEEGNFATTIKETLGLWVKDFPYSVMTDYLATKPVDDRKMFLDRIRSTRSIVTEFLVKEIEANLSTLNKFYANSINQKYNPQAMMAHLIAWKTEEIKNNGGELPADLNKNSLKKLYYMKEEYSKHIDNIESEFKSFKEGILDVISSEILETINRIDKSANDRPPVPGRQQAETFGTGLGVRKETFLDASIGLKNYRVAEVRSSDDLADVEDNLAKMHTS